MAVLSTLYNVLYTAPSTAISRTNRNECI
uniref:Uncharacterized protein n=1 Tax=Arundo donax TaxID=35708 RepID=A0A0A9CAC8_ARUDO